MTNNIHSSFRALRRTVFQGGQVWGLPKRPALSVIIICYQDYCHSNHEISLQPEHKKKHEERGKGWKLVIIFRVHPTPLPPPILFYYTIKTSILKFLYKKTNLLLLKLIPLCLQVFLWFFKAKTIPNVCNCWYNKSMKVFLWGIQVHKHYLSPI